MTTSLFLSREQAVTFGKLYDTCWNYRKLFVDNIRYGEIVSRREIVKEALRDRSDTCVRS